MCLKTSRLTWSLAAITILSCTSCNHRASPMDDLHKRIEARMKPHSCFKIESIKKYVKEEKEGINHVYYYKVTYLVTKDSYFKNAQLTLDLRECSPNEWNHIELKNKQLFSELVVLDYSNDKLSQIRFFPGGSEWIFKPGELEN